MSAQQPTILYTLTDEAPLLATASFLPIIAASPRPAGIQVDEPATFRWPPACWLLFPSA
jgi:isocitrate dehydrogenase